MPNAKELSDRLRSFVNRDRLVKTVTDLVAEKSWTGNARPALDRLAQILADDGFEVERPTAKQIQSLHKLIAYLMVTYHVTPDNIIRHKDTKAPDCPGKYLNIDLVRRQSAILAGASLKGTKLSASGELLQDVAAAQ